MALADRALALVNIPSESRNEAALTAYIEGAVPLEPAFSDGESLLYAKRSGKPLVLLAGHSDTVPALLRALHVTDTVTLSDDDYDNLFIVVAGKDGRPVLLRLKY